MGKRILMLGGSAAQVPAIAYARKAGYYVITVDYLPENPGHAVSNEYYNVSTTDRDAVLALAGKLGVDGIVAYASDPAAPTAAFVAEQLGLPTSPFNAVNTLARKDIFRAFQEQHGFRAPRFKSCRTLAEAQAAAAEIGWPVVVKPVDSSGSKGITVAEDAKAAGNAFDAAMTFTRYGTVIVEEFIGKLGEQILGEAFVYNGQIAFCCLAEHWFDMECTALVPIGGIFPHPHLDKVAETRCRREFQRLLDAVGHTFGAMNLEFRFNGNGDVYIIEAGPRNGGNMIPQLIHRATGMDMVKHTVDAALGEDCSDVRDLRPDGCYAYYVIHSRQDGRLKSLSISHEIAPFLVDQFIWAKPGDAVGRFMGSNFSLGVLILRTESSTDMTGLLNEMEALALVDLER